MTRRAASVSRILGYHLQEKTDEGHFSKGWQQGRPLRKAINLPIFTSKGSRFSDNG